MSWPTCNLDLLRANSPYAFVGGPFGSNLTTRDYVEQGIPVIRGSNLPSEGLFHDEGFVFVSEKKADSLRSNTAYPGDLVFTQRGTLGQVGLIPQEARFTRYIVSQSQMKISIDDAKANARFIYYFFRLPTTVQMLINKVATSGVPHINLAVLKKFQVPFPNLTVQNKVAAILSAYDNLLENNHRRMVLLEDSARHLYREWFVRLCFPGHEHVNVAGGVPAGWERRDLAGCATFLSGGTPSKARSDFWEGDIPWVSSGELTDMRVHDTSLRITAEGAEMGSRLVPRETILAVVRGMSLARDWRVSITSREVAFNQDLKALVAKPDIDPLYLFHTLETQRDQVRDRAGEASHGTKKLDTAVLANLPILVPAASMQRLFREAVAPLHALWDNLHIQNEKLRAARDLLLPRLMSGEIVV